MKSFLMSLTVAALMALGGCDANEGDSYGADREAIANQNDSSGVPEGGPESPPDETMYEGAVPEYEEAESGEVADGDW